MTGGSGDCACLVMLAVGVIELPKTSRTGSSSVITCAAPKICVGCVLKLEVVICERMQICYRAL